MPRGGPRPGSGRKVGSVAKVNAQARKKALEGGISPLDYMLKVMRGTGDSKRRDTMAVAAAPYVHAKLASVQHTGRNGGPITTMDLTKATDEQIAALEAIFGPLAESGGGDGGDQSGEGAAGD